MFRFRIVVRLPGSVTSNAPGQASNGAEWEPTLSQAAPVTLVAKGEAYRTSTLVFTGIAVVAFVALVVLLLIRLAVFSRRRRLTSADA